MADPRSPGVNDDIGAAPGRGSLTGTPRWVKVGWMIVVVVVLLVVILFLVGGAPRPGSPRGAG